MVLSELDREKGTTFVNLVEKPLFFDNFVTPTLFRCDETIFRSNTDIICSSILRELDVIAPDDSVSIQPH